ncbi:amidohydrolase [Candidatus Xianfuyuplasma coldseepsis]|uniref:Amidohydrolase n=1 Tax=Candidatus Xianfuyuplasma coldseepsis TaxID=2782163 RepID=A0A7L7KRD9_9MOLU|nr:amidohydrolase [Xianfuyuplasma coldseepsis]QMS84514.1 amidohydrolase [Xianfuyuplasma coldseepsis]
MIRLTSVYDSHLHVLGIGIQQRIADCSEFATLAELSSYSNDNPKIIVSRGWHESQFIEKRTPTKFDLNHISKSMPVILIRTCGHVLVCNDKAMELAGITSDTPQIEGGSFDYKTGIFTEDAMDLIMKIVPPPSKEELKEMFISANNYLLSQGITSVGSDDFSIKNVHYEDIIEVLEELYHEGLMQIHLYEQVNLPSIKLQQDFLNKGYHKKTYNGFKMGPLKLLADGSMGGRTAYLNKDYSDDPGNKGIQVFKQSELEDLIYLADSNGMDVAIHAIGDGMIDLVLDAIEKSIRRTKRNHRHSIIHAQLATKQQIQRMKQLGVAAIVQPIFLNSDIGIVHERLGDRANESYLFKTMYKEGVHVAFSTDAPVEPVNPFYNLYTAITRTSIKQPELGEFLPEEKFTLDEALECYQNSYYMSYDEHKNYNDYIIVDRDIHNCTVEELKDTVVLETYIDGKLVYKRDKK